MTYDDIVFEVENRLNLSSLDAQNRIGRSVNERYRWLVTSLGLETAARTTVTVNTTIGNPYLTFPNTTKLLSVFDATVTPVRVLQELTFDELRNRTTSTDPPQLYAIATMQAQSVAIFLNCIPASSYPLTADCYRLTVQLSSGSVPAFPEDFHDLLIYGAMSTELKKMEKPSLAQDNENVFQQRVSDLRMFIAKSAYLQIVQGKNSGRLRGGWGV